MQANPGDIFIFPGNSGAKIQPTENDQIFIKIPQSRNGDQEIRLSLPTDVFSTRAQTESCSGSTSQSWLRVLIKPRAPAALPAVRIGVVPRSAGGRDTASMERLSGILSGRECGSERIRGTWADSA